MMNYISTRGDQTERRFCDILLEGLAPDGGLYLPIALPADRRRHADEVARPGLCRSGLRDPVALHRRHSGRGPARDHPPHLHEAVFGTPQITPLKVLEPGLALQALSNGPTLAFKDMAMQLLGQLFEYELGRRGQTLNILGATSGDTGSAAEYAMRGKAGVNVFMLSPHGRMSPFQQAQMFSLQTPTSTTSRSLACSTIARTSSRRCPMTSNSSASTGSAPSTRSTGRGCWPRSSTTSPAICRRRRANEEKVSFTVPSGNFGNVCAGHVARMMGLPIAQLVVATNENDVLDEFFRTGVYRPRGTADTHETSSPSMDISKASNFERFVFDLLDRDGARVKALFRRRPVHAERRGKGADRRLRLPVRLEQPCRPSGHDPCSAIGSTAR